MRWIAGATVLTLAAGLPVSSANAAERDQTTTTYIVQTTGDPAAATPRPAGQRFRADTAEFRGYDARLRGQHHDVMRAAGISDQQKLYDYTTVLNGFAARLTPAQAAILATTPGVLTVTPDKVSTVQLDPPAAPRQQPAAQRPLSGAPKPRPAVSKQTPEGQTPKAEGLASKPAAALKAGEGMIIGVLDTGILPEHPSFAPLSEPRPDARVIAAKWHGICDPGREAPKVTCDNKLIGARYYRSPDIPLVPEEYDSPRDWLGHGTSTAGIAAGDANVQATYYGADAGVISGIAPEARIADYKVIWERTDYQGVGTASAADVIAAINQAVVDGVDVLNYSASLPHQPIEVESLAFLNAAAAGVFVAAAAGNSGPGAVVNAEPWVTTVAAAGVDRGLWRLVRLGNGASYYGVGVGTALQATALVDAAQSAAPGVSATDASQCKSGSLDPTAVTGKIVLCLRGSTLPELKAEVVKAAGGVGMLIGDPTNSYKPSFYAVPTVDLDAAGLAAVQAYLAGGPGTAAFSGEYTWEAPYIAYFSSGGPAETAGGDLLKPDIAAPGDFIVVASAPGKRGTELFSYGSGTSYATPWIAGQAALLKVAHPNWSPAEIRSALMTTATQTDNTGGPILRGTQPATPLDFGAGYAVPAKALDPGLVYDSTATQWRTWACELGVPVPVHGRDFCKTAAKPNPSNLNYPTIAIGDLFGTQTVTRTVTNVSNKTSSYQVAVAAPAGVRVTVTPKKLTVRPGRSARFTVSFQRVAAAYGAFAFGALTWTDHQGHVVRSPIAVRPVAVASTPVVTSSKAVGSVAVPVRTGYAGKLTARAAGPVAGTVTDLPLSIDGGPVFDTANPVADGRTGAYDVTVPPGTLLARFATYAADLPPGSDVDVYVYKKGADGSLTLAGAGATEKADEAVDLTEPGDYRVFVCLFTLPGATTTTVRPTTYLLGGAPSGLTVTPAVQPAHLAGRATVTARWSGLHQGTRYAGVVVLGDGSTDRASTLFLLTP